MYNRLTVVIAAVFVGLLILWTMIRLMQPTRFIINEAKLYDSEMKSALSVPVSKSLFPAAGASPEELSITTTTTIANHQNSIGPELIPYLKSQMGQDRWLFVNNIFNVYDSRGFFIEFGARNGEDHSNSYFLQKRFQWHGLLAEAARNEQKNIVQVRGDKAAIIDGAICDSDNRQIQFADFGIMGWGGAVSDYDPKRLKDHRSNMHVYPVQCYRLDTLLDQFGVEAVDYMSVDTEGNELQSLLSFPFDRIPVRVLNIEVLIGEGRERRMADVVNFMRRRGYKLLSAIGGGDTLDAFFEPDFDVSSYFNRPRFSLEKFEEEKEKCKQKMVNGRPMCLK